MKNNDVTILTLFGGRWHTLEPFLQGLIGLDWPAERLRLLWYANASETFVGPLKIQAEWLKSKGYRIDLVRDATLPPAARVFHEGDLRSVEHLNAIAVLYNAAWQHVRTNDALFLEDDVVAPSHALKRLTAALDAHPKAAIAASCVFDRHNAGVVFVWDVVQAPVFKNGRIRFRHELVPPGQPWGVRRVSAGGFSCTLIRRARLPKALRAEFPFKVKNPIKGQEHINGCDLVFCLEAQRYGREVYADFDVRALHIDSQARIH